jgi:hypothetical protein
MERGRRIKRTQKRRRGVEEKRSSESPPLLF